MEYQQERFTLNSFCEFRNREVESEFVEYEKPASLSTVRFLTLLMGLIFFLFVISDYFFYNDTFFLSLGLRAAALLISIITFFFAGKFRHYEHTLITVTAAELSVFVIYLINLYHMKNHQPALQFMTIMLFILAVFLIPNRWKHCLITSCIILIGYIVFCAVTQAPTESPPLVSRAVYLGISVVCCALSILSREKARRKQFAAEKHLEFMSITDKLTGIYNRGRFEYILGLWIKSMRHFPFCLLFFDIDNFKNVNDRYGHMAGDQVLVEITNIISSHIRDDDIFARWGGEEFVILFGSMGIERAAELAERLRKAVGEHINKEAGKITISIGVVQYRIGELPDELINRVDGKMYEAKQAGKNRVVAEIIQEDAENT